MSFEIGGTYMGKISQQAWNDLNVELNQATHKNVYHKHGQLTSGSSWYFSILRLNQTGHLEGHIHGNNIEIKYRINPSLDIFITLNTHHSGSQGDNKIINEVRMLISRARKLNASNKSKFVGRRGKTGEYYLQRRKTKVMSSTLTKAKNQGVISNLFANDAHSWGFSMWEKK